MSRREFITILGSAAAGWPFAANAQPAERMRTVGVTIPAASDDQVYRERVAGFLQRLHELGWLEGRNLRVEYRWSVGNAENTRRPIEELLRLAPDVILANGARSLAPLRELTRTVSIVFVGVVDPVGAGYVASLARPGGNITGFTNFEYSLTAKWPELLKEIAPHVTRVAVVRDPTVAAGSGQFGVIQAMSSLLGMEVMPIDPRDALEIEPAIVAFASRPNGALILTPTAFSTIHRELIIRLAGRHRLPAIYPASYFVTGGGLISYGPDIADQYKRAASYVDRILKGEKPADLPVQAPTKYELVINLKTAKALGIDVSATLLARSDRVIE